MKLYEDDYFQGFESGADGFDGLLALQKDLEADTIWEAVNTDLEVLPMETPMDVEARHCDPMNTIPKEILLDTCEHSGILLSYVGKTTCLRDCAMPSLLNTAGISGPGVGRASKVNLAKGLSAFLSNSRQESRVMIRGNKISAVVSTQYEYMPISELLEICEDLEDTFGVMHFRSGSVSHDLTTAEFAFPDVAQQITTAYNAVLINAGRPNSKELLTPIVQFRASDTSSKAAQLTTFLKMGSRLVPIGGFKVPHVAPLEFDENHNRITCIDKFRRESSTLFSKFEYNIKELLPKMLETEIHYPGNCFVGLCKYASIPQKWGGIIEENLRNDWPNHAGCTFLDVYEALTEVTALALNDGLAPYSRRILDLEEGISKISRDKAYWTKYDLPGTVAWTQKVPVI